MSLKSIHEARRIQNEPKNSSDSQLIEEQRCLIGELQGQISELSSTNSTLMSELRKKSETIRSLNEQIGKLSESDNVLKQNERLEREKQEAIQRADTVVQNCKAEYEQKVRELDRQKNRAERMEQDAKVAMARQQALIRANAEAMSKAERSRLESQYKAKTAGYEGVMLGSLLYGTLCTLFAAARSETFISDFKAFFGVIWSFIRLCADKVFQVAKWAAQVGDMIPQPTVSAIVHWLIQIILVVGVAVGVGFLLFIGGEKLYSGYKEHFADQISLAELLISFAVVVFFAEPIREALPVNLLLLLLICHGACMDIRQYIKGWRRARGYY